MKTWIWFRTDDPLIFDRIMQVAERHGSIKGFEYDRESRTGETSRGIQLPSEEAAFETLKTLQGNFPTLDVKLSER